MGAPRKPEAAEAPGYPRVRPEALRDNADIVFALCDVSERDSSGVFRAIKLMLSPDEMDQLRAAVVAECGTFSVARVVQWFNDEQLRVAQLKN